MKKLTLIFLLLGIVLLTGGCVHFSVEDGDIVIPIDQFGSSK